MPTHPVGAIGREPLDTLMVESNDEDHEGAVLTGA